MEMGGEKFSIHNKFTCFYETIKSICGGIKSKKEKLTYLKKIIRDCDRIIELTEIFDEEEIEINNLVRVAPDIDSNFYWLLDDNKASPQLINPLTIEEPHTRYMSFELEKMSKNNPNFKIDGIKRIKMQMEFDSEMIAREVNETSYQSMAEVIEEPINKIKILSSISDVVRIFEGMRKAGIISSKTTTKQIGELFFTEIKDVSSFEKKYNATKSRIEKEESTSRSNELVNFIKVLCEDSFVNKEIQLDELIIHLEKLQNRNII